MLARVSNFRCVPNLVDEFFGNDWLTTYNPNKWYGSTTPAVNVVENKDNFRIEVAAPGLSKDDFKINVDNDVLTISSQKGENKEETDEKYTRKEFYYASFSRSFTLTDTVDSEKISASYKDGVLLVSVPKKEAKVIPVREVAIS